MSLTLQILVSGVAAGGVYGLVAVAHSLIFRLTGIVHFAFGDLIGLGVFVALLVAAGRGPVTQATAGGPRFVVALLVGVGVCVAAGVLSYVLAVQPYLAQGSTLGWVASLLAIAFAIRALISAVFERPSYVFPDPLPFRKVGEGGVIVVGGASLHVRAFFVIFVALVLAFAARLALARTRQGRGLQAIAADAEGARVVGVPVEGLTAAALGLAGGLAAIAAIVAAPSGPVDVDTGTLLGLKGLVAALVVQFGSPLGAMASGIVLGVVEATLANTQLAGVDLGPLREILPLAIVLVLLAARPLARAREALE